MPIWSFIDAVSLLQRPAMQAVALSLLFELWLAKLHHIAHPPPPPHILPSIQASMALSYRITCKFIQTLSHLLNRTKEKLTQFYTKLSYYYIKRLEFIT